MIITMQGNWTVRVKARNADFPQRFIISGATTGNGTYNGITTTPAVAVTGSQWTIAIQHNPGTGFQLSDSKIIFPQTVGGNYEFDIQSNDTGSDEDFNDLVLSCATPATANTFLIYGNVSLYSGHCVFNPCRRDIFVIETPSALETVLQNPRLREILEKLYPERVPPFKIDPNPPDPPYFKPLVLDLFGEALQPKTTFSVQPLEAEPVRTKASSKNAVEAETSFRVEKNVSARSLATESVFAASRFDIAKSIDKFFRVCRKDPGTGLTLTFEEYDRTVFEQAGGPYTGTGDRRLLGDTITDMFGNYIFRYSFDMTFPNLEDADDTFPGQSVNEFAYPDVIVKVTGLASWDVQYESAPYYNIPNLRRINLCLPRSRVKIPASCANGNLIGSLGNVFIGGDQNTSASTAPAALTRYGNGNFLEPTGVVTVGSGLADFTAECAAWTGVIDIFGCIYDETKALADNRIKWYTIRIRRAGVANWTYVSENYKHPKFSKRNLPGYTGDDVGPFPRTIAGMPNTPAYKNIRHELHTGGADTDWENAHIDRLIKLHTGLYDIDNGEHKPGKFYVQINGYDDAGSLVAGKTDLVALFIHNKGLDVRLTELQVTDPAVDFVGCGLYRLEDTQNRTPISISFIAEDTAEISTGVPLGFVNGYSLTVSRCPAPMIGLQESVTSLPLPGLGVIAQGTSTSTHNSCAGFTGTGLRTVVFEPGATEDGWIKEAEYFSIYSFTLSARQRVTNGYNSGLSGSYDRFGQIMMEKINP